MKYRADTRESLSFKIIRNSIVFIYIPVFIFMFLAFYLIKNENLNKNISIIDTKFKLFITLLEEERVNLNILSNIVYEEVKTDNVAKSNDMKYINDYFLKIKNKYNISEVSYSFLYREQDNTENSGQKIFFYQNKLVLLNEIKVGNCIISLKQIFNAGFIKNILIDNTDLTVIYKGNSIMLSTQENPINPKEKISVNSKKKRFYSMSFLLPYYYKNYSFPNDFNLRDYYVEILIHPELYKIFSKNIAILVGIFSLLWIIFSFIYFFDLRKFLLTPINVLIGAFDDMVKGNYKTIEILNSSDDFGKLTMKFNMMALSFQAKDQETSLSKQKLETQVISRTNKLQIAVEKLREMDNRQNDWFYSVIHDLKNPLTVIQGYASMLSSYENLSEEKKKEFAKKIEKETFRLTDMLNEFLKSSREESMYDNIELKEIDVLHLAEYFTSIYEIKAKERNIKLSLIFHNRIPTVFGDRESLEHVFSNLMSNAFKFVKDDGTISISIDVINNFVKIGVYNSDSAIDEDKKDEIFEKYKKFSTESNSNKSGTGLGLYIVKKIIGKHKGRVWVENSAAGVIFYFSLLVYNRDTN